MAKTTAETTPNPNSLKFTADSGSFTPGGMETYSSAEEAQDNALARRLLSISGVEDVFITPQFVTVSKQPTAEWNRIKPEVETILTTYLEA